MATRWQQLTSTVTTSVSIDYLLLRIITKQHKQTSPQGLFAWTGKGNEKLHQYLCELNRPVGVNGPSYSVMLDWKTMEKWGSNAASIWCGGAGWECWIRGALIDFLFLCCCRMTEAAMEPLPRSLGTTLRVTQSTPCFTRIHTIQAAAREDSAPKLCCTSTYLCILEHLQGHAQWMGGG